MLCGCDFFVISIIVCIHHLGKRANVSGHVFGSCRNRHHSVERWWRLVQVRIPVP